VMAQGHRQYVMCPLLDLANRKPSNNAEVQYDYVDDGLWHSWRKTCRLMNTAGKSGLICIKGLKKS
jgi:hypothetical protein